MQPVTVTFTKLPSRGRLGLFLGEYLLYRYDHDDQADESGE